MATQKIKSTSKVIDYGSDEQEMMNSGAYGMTKAQAENIVKSYEDNPNTALFEKYEKALAFLDGLKTKPVPIDTAPGHFSKHQYDE